MARPYICLNMIVKNEAHIIRETLENVWKYIQYYVINDTGSTDNTVEVIKEFFNEKGIPGEVIIHEFRTCTCHSGIYKKYDFFHFGWNRTFALSQCWGKSEYIWIMDADDVIVGDFKIPPDMKEDCYLLKIGQKCTYRRPQIFKNDAALAWHYVGPLHEYANCKNDKHTKKYLDGDYYLDSRRLGDRSKDKDKYLKDARIFEQVLEDEPNNDRYMFYCGQSFYDYGDYLNAIKYYEKRTKMGKWFEEVFYSHLRIGKAKEKLERPWPEIEKSYLSAFESCKFRSESLYHIAEHYYDEAEFNKCYDYAKKATNIKISDNSTLFIDNDIYIWRAKELLASVAFELGKYMESLTCFKQVLSYVSGSDLEDLRESIKECETKINEKNKQTCCFYLGNEPLMVGNLSHRIISHATNFYKVIVVGNKIDNYCINNVVVLTVNQFKLLDVKSIEQYVLLNNINFFYDMKFKSTVTLVQYDDLFWLRLDNDAKIGISNHTKLNEIFKNINKVVCIEQKCSESFNNNFNINPPVINHDYHLIYEIPVTKYEFKKSFENDTNGYIFINPPYIEYMIENIHVYPYATKVIEDYGNEIIRLMQGSQESYYNMAKLQIANGNYGIANELLNKALKGQNKSKTYSDIIQLRKAEILFKNKKYEDSYNLANQVMSRNLIPECLRKDADDIRDRNVEYLKDAYLKYPVKKIMILPDCVNNPQNYNAVTQNKSNPKIMFSVTTCKRYDLFEKTMNSFLNACTDSDLIDHWLCVDDNSSDEDRKKMQKNYPFFEFVWKDQSQKGHWISMNIIRSKAIEYECTYDLHMEDDFHFIQKRNYLTESIKIMKENQKIGQVLFNKNYAEVELYKRRIPGGHIKSTKDGMRYLIHEYYPPGSADYDKFIERHKGEGTCGYWPHFSFRPSVVKVSMLKDIGVYFNTAHFEMRYAEEYIDNGYVSAFIDTFSCIHIGKKTWEKDVTNSYNLNEMGQFENVNKKLSVNVISQYGTPERWKAFKEGAKILKHYTRMIPKPITTLSDFEKKLFHKNNFNYRRSIIGSIMNHIKAIQTCESDYLMVLKDNVVLIDTVDDILGYEFDMIILDYSADNTEKIVHYDYGYKLVLENLNGYLLSKTGMKKILDYIETHGIKNVEYLNEPNILETFILNKSIFTVESTLKSFNETIPSFPGYTFYSQLDSYGNDEGYYHGKNIHELKKICDEKGCLAFNTLGYVKHTVADEKEFIYLPKSKSVKEGMYVKNL